MCKKKKKKKKRVMNHFSQAPPYIHISNHITLKNTPFGSCSKTCYDLKDISKIIKQRF